jgi:hypothetical protein
VYQQLTLRFVFLRHQDAEQMAGRMLNCPHVVGPACADANTLRLTFLVPASKLGWALALAREPGLIGATSAVVEASPAPAACPAESTALARTIPPCGSDCSRCTHYLNRCGGCPITPFFRPGYVFV